MKRKHQRLFFLLITVSCFAGASLLVLHALKHYIVFFHTPADIKATSIAPSKRLRLGGVVKEGSVERKENHITFQITDYQHDIAVSYQGSLPDLFREGQGVVAEGYLVEGLFKATTILAKHDETYMPPEVADALKKKGVWRGPSSPSLSATK